MDQPEELDIMMAGAEAIQLQADQPINFLKDALVLLLLLTMTEILLIFGLLMALIFGSLMALILVLMTVISVVLIFGLLVALILDQIMALIGYRNQQFEDQNNSLPLQRLHDLADNLMDQALFSRHQAYQLQLLQMEMLIMGDFFTLSDTRNLS